MDTWPLQPNQPFYIQTAFGPAIYNPSTGTWCPIFAAQHPQAPQFPPPAQPNLLTPAVNPPSAAASPSSPPPQPSTSAVPQSTYTPTDDMVEALEALSREKWKMKTALRPQQVLACATLHEDKASDGIVLNVDRTGGGKSHTMRLSCAYEGGIGIITIPLLALRRILSQSTSLRLILFAGDCHGLRNGLTGLLVKQQLPLPNKIMLLQFEIRDSCILEIMWLRDQYINIHWTNHGQVYTCFQSHTTKNTKYK